MSSFIEKSLKFLLRDIELINKQKQILVKKQYYEKVAELRGKEKDIQESIVRDLRKRHEEGISARQDLYIIEKALEEAGKDSIYELDNIQVVELSHRLVTPGYKEKSLL